MKRREITINADRVVTVVGTLVFAAALIIHIAEGGRPPSVVFDAAMLLMFLGDLFGLFAPVGEMWRGFVREASTLFSGSALVAAFAFFAATATTVPGLLLTIGITLLGGVMVIVSGGRLNAARRAVKNG